MRKPLILAYCRRQAAGANCSAVALQLVAVAVGQLQLVLLQLI